MSSLKIPTSPVPKWARNPAKWYTHQLLLQQLVDWCEDNGIPVLLPEEVEGRPHDAGTDLLIGESRIAVDLKQFWLRKDAKTYTWISPYHAFYEGRKAFYKGRETQYYIHADFTVPADQWLVADAHGLHRSFFPKRAPFYYRDDVTSLGKFTFA